MIVEFPKASAFSLWVLFLAIAALFFPVILIEYQVLHSTGGVLMYPLDDTFIHLAIAKNLALHNIWGIPGKEFQSASSSVLFTLILYASFKVFGIKTIIPLIINVIAALATLIAIQRWLVRESIPKNIQLTILVLVIFLTPLPILIVTSMEHTLQCLFSFLFIISFSDWLSKMKVENTKKRKLSVNVLIYGFLLCGIRYEGIFLVAIACLFLFINKRIWLALLLGFIATLLPIIFGIYSLTKGSFFLPNSVLVKSVTPPLSIRGLFKYFSDFIFPRLAISYGNISTVASQRLLLILPICLLFINKTKNTYTRYKSSLSLLFGATILQITLASVAWFYRYEAHLFLLTTVFMTALIYKEKLEISNWFKSNTIIKGFLIFVLILPLLGRSRSAFRDISLACYNIYSQQYQIAQFLKENYSNEVVAVNDIGAVSFYRDGFNIDLEGLANIKIAKSIRGKYYSSHFLDSICLDANAKIAVVYDSWFEKSLLQRWEKVATWTIPNNVVCGDSTVSFYAIDKAFKAGLKGKLVTFKDKLPSGIHVQYFEGEAKSQ